MCRCSHAHYIIIILQHSLYNHYNHYNLYNIMIIESKACTILTIFIIIKISTNVILLKLWYL